MGYDNNPLNGILKLDNILAKTSHEYFKNEKNNEKCKKISLKSKDI